MYVYTITQQCGCIITVYPVCSDLPVVPAVMPAPPVPTPNTSMALLEESKAALDGANDTESNAQEILNILDAQEKLRFVLLWNDTSG